MKKSNRVFIALIATLYIVPALTFGVAQFTSEKCLTGFTQKFQIIQIAERICDRVLSGNYKADSRIPSVRELAVEMEVNPNTVMRSFERLQANEIIYNKRGIGYFVASDAEQKIREMRHNQFVEEVLPAVFKEMHLLDVGIDELTKAYTLYISTIK